MDVPSVDAVTVIDVVAGELAGEVNDGVFCGGARESASDDGDVIGTGDGDGQRFRGGDAAEGVGGRDGELVEDGFAVMERLDG